MGGYSLAGSISAQEKIVVRFAVQRRNEKRDTTLKLTVIGRILLQKLPVVSVWIAVFRHPRRARQELVIALHVTIRDEKG
jgi:hypothetical protein